MAFSMADTCIDTSGNEFKIFKPHCNLDVRKFSFSNRVVNLWNSLAEDIVGCNSVESFK